MKGLELMVARRKAGMHQLDLALRLGIDSRRLSEMECERRPIPEELAQQIEEFLRTKDEAKVK